MILIRFDDIILNTEELYILTRQGRNEKNTAYKQIFVQRPCYEEEIIFENIKQTLITQRSLTYMIDDFLLDNNMSLTPTTFFILNNFQYHNSHFNIPNLAPFTEILSNALILYSVMHQNKGRLSKSEKADLKISCLETTVRD